MYNDRIYEMALEMLQPVEEGQLLNALKDDIRRLKNKKTAKQEQANVKDNILELGEKDFDKLLKDIQMSIISYLKKYSTSPEFKKKYKDYLYMIKIVPEMYGDPYSVQICEEQDGIDWDKVYKWEKDNPGHDAEWYGKNCPYYENGWYDELLRVGKRYADDNYADVFKKYGIHIGTGDGDECNIYIECRWYYNKNHELVKNTYVSND